MSFTCNKHGWSHLFKECPSCNTFTTSSGSSFNYLPNNNETTIPPCFRVDCQKLRAENEKLKKQVKIWREALKTAEGYMFMACQPDQGNLFSEFDDKNREALSKIESLDKVTEGEKK